VAHKKTNFTGYLLYLSPNSNTETPYKLRIIAALTFFQSATIEPNTFVKLILQNKVEIPSVESPFPTIEKFTVNRKQLVVAKCDFLIPSTSSQKEAILKSKYLMFKYTTDGKCIEEEVFFHVLFKYSQ